MKKRHQIVVPPFTPYTPSGAVDLDAIHSVAHHVAQAGAEVIWINGTSGESVLLSKNERKKIVEKWRAVVTENKLPLKLIVHVGCDCLEDAAELAVHARDVGMDAVACIGPSFFKPVSVMELVEYLGKVAGSVPEMDFYYYHYPLMNNIRFPVAQILQYGKKVIPNLRGAKITDVDAEGLDWALHISGPEPTLTGARIEKIPPISDDFEIFIGFSTIALMGYFQGAAGGFVYDFMVYSFKQMTDAFENGNLRQAQNLQTKIARCYRDILKEGGMAAAKYASSVLILGKGGKGGVRLPLKDVSEEEKRNIDLLLKEYEELFCKKASL